jgi:Putative peptidoglycan binding domain
MSDEYAKCECAVCHRMVPKNHAISEDIERATGGVILVAVYFGSGTSKVSPNDTTASITKQNLIRSVDAPMAATYAVTPDTTARPRPTPVQEAQSILVKLGYDVGVPDGKMGPKTKTALQRFTAIEHLDFYGGVSDEMLATLRVRARETEQTLATLRGRARGQ